MLPDVRMARITDAISLHLVLQLHILVEFVAASHSLRLMLASPEGPAQGGGHFDRRPEHEPGEESADFGRARQENRDPAYAAKAFGLASFALPGGVGAGFGRSQVVRRRSAARRARKAAAAMTSVTWRCQPCQERASQ